MKTNSTITGILFVLISISVTFAKQSYPDNLDSVDTETPAKSRPIEINASRGQLLYENHCLSCHESLVHIREKRKARNISGISYFVIIRASELKLQWGNEEIESVTQYLNHRFYKYTE